MSSRKRAGNRLLLGQLEEMLGRRRRARPAPRRQGPAGIVARVGGARRHLDRILHQGGVAGEPLDQLCGGVVDSCCAAWGRRELAPALPATLRRRSARTAPAPLRAACGPERPRESSAEMTTLGGGPPAPLSAIAVWSRAGPPPRAPPRPPRISGYQPISAPADPAPTRAEAHPRSPGCRLGQSGLPRSSLLAGRPHPPSE